MFYNDGEMPAYIAEQLERKSKDHPIIFDEELAYGLDFTQKDLEANRNGYMTERQHHVLKQVARKATKPLVPTTIFAWLMSFGFLFGLLQTQDFGIFLTFSAILFGAILATASITSFYTPINLDIHDGAVELANGKVVLQLNVNKVYTVNHLTIKRYGKFKLHRRAYLRFKHLEPYIIYYAPNSRIILSAMPIEETS